jgi:type I restriction enzyme M protein
LTEYDMPSDILDLNLMFSAILRLERLGENRKAFRRVLTIPLSAKISNIVRIALDFKRQKLLGKFDIHSLLLKISSKYTRILTPPIPIEIVYLIIGLAGKIEGKNIYCPWDNLSEFASIIDKMVATVSIESVQNSVFPWLVNIFNETNIEISIGNPIQQPGFLLKEELRKFDTTITFPPLAIKYDSSICHGDLYNRFPEKTGSGAVLNIRHVLAQTIGKAVIAVPNSVLFSSGVEQSFRQDLLEKNQIEAVISLPPALLVQSSIPFSIIVFDNQRRESDLTVSFVNGNDERFFAKDGRGRSRLVNWEDLLDTLRQGEDESYVVRVPVQKILENNSYLEVSAYTLPPERKKADRILSDSQTADLSELVNFFRPPLKQKIADTIDTDRCSEALEITIGDFTEYGYAQAPARIVSIEEDSNNESNYFLKPRDVLIAVKANTGKVAIVSDAADLAEDTPWIVNQSCLILRCKDKIDPRILFMYLSSEMGQYLLKSLSSGATIPLIQLARLKKLQIVIPPHDEAEQIIRDFDRLVELQSQIETVKQQQKILSSSHWSL